MNHDINIATLLINTDQVASLILLAKSVQEKDYVKLHCISPAKIISLLKNDLKDAINFIALEDILPKKNLILCYKYTSINLEIAIKPKIIKHLLFHLNLKAISYCHISSIVSSIEKVNISLPRKDAVFLINKDNTEYIDTNFIHFNKTKAIKSAINNWIKLTQNVEPNEIINLEQNILKNFILSLRIKTIYNHSNIYKNFSLSTSCKYNKEQINSTLQYYNQIEVNTFRDKKIILFNPLDNNINLNYLIRYLIRYFDREKINYPSPLYNADSFCQYIMTPTKVINGYDVAPIVTALLHFRQDIKQAYPHAEYNKEDAPFLKWLDDKGHKEENLQDLYTEYAYLLTKPSPIELALSIINTRDDLKTHFKNIYSSNINLKEYSLWIDNNGVNEEEFITVEVAHRFRNSLQGFQKVFVLYLYRNDIQETYYNLGKQEILNSFIHWLYTNLRFMSDITEDEAVLFSEISRRNLNKMGMISLVHNRRLHRLTEGKLSAFNLENFKFLSKIGVIDYQEKEISKIIECISYPSITEQFYTHYHLKLKTTNNLTEDLARNLIHASNKNNINNKYITTVIKDNIGINQIDKEIAVFAYLNATTGIGQSGRSFIDIITHTGIPIKQNMLPSYHMHPDHILSPEDCITYSNYTAALRKKNIIIANADSSESIKTLVPDIETEGYYNIGFWVWETDKLPEKYENSADIYNEIWTPSEYSADALRKTIDLPIKVLPHAINLAEIDEIIQNPSQREIFSLQEDAFYFGFIFDAKSVVQRKNPKAIVDAFKLATANIEDCPKTHLVFKVSSANYDDPDYLEFLSSTKDNDNIHIIEETWERNKVLQFINSLDCYISLHRSEGFGLTLAEAMAMGKITIATAYSGNTTFMQDDNSILIDYQLVKTEKTYGAYPKGTLWAEANIETAAKYMADIINNTEKYNHTALKGKIDIHLHFSAASLSQKLHQIINAQSTTQNQ